MSWENFKKYYLELKDSGIRLDFSKIGFEEAFFAKMSGKIELALENMSSLESGAIANVDEDRMVGHYWLRNSDLAPTAEIKDAIEQNIIKIKDFADKIKREGKFKRLLCIGIGGSALGPQFLYEALFNNTGLKTKFLDNTDPDGIYKVLEEERDFLHETLVVVTSKSGSTPEPRNAFLETKSFYEGLGHNFAQHAVAITGDGSQLFNLAKQEAWLGIFPLWDWVGGRTSIWSSVGLLPAALQGIDIDGLLLGAFKMDERTRSKDYKKNPALMLALAWYEATKGVGERNMVILPYRDALCSLSKYLQQLIMESLGKRLDLDGKEVFQGITVYGNKGSTDQHAYIQQLRDGIDDFFVNFIEVLTSSYESKVEVEEGLSSADYLEGFFLGTRSALSEIGRLSITTTLDKINSLSIGGLIALFERAVGYYASFVNINAYHQPGVEAGKKAAKSILSLKRDLLNTLSENKETSFSVEELSKKLNANTEEVFKLLEYIRANQG